jgi:hypothetical protein
LRNFQSAFGAKFVLRRPPPSATMETLLKQYSAGVKPTITFKYYGFSSNQLPLYPICIQVFPSLSHQLTSLKAQR